MNKIIDIHAHLGDIFCGQNITFRTRLQRPDHIDDSFAQNARDGFVFKAEGRTAEQLQDRMREGQNRLAHATCENLGKSMDDVQAAYSVALPILPYTSFDEHLAASRLDPRILPFSCPDYSLPQDETLEKLRQDIANGARGLKIHSVLSNLPMTDPRTLACIELFGNAGLPVLFHVGVSHYYTFGQPYKETPEYGGLDDFITVAHMFPDYDLIAAHCVNNYVRELAEKTAGLNRILHGYDLLFRRQDRRCRRGHGRRQDPPWYGLSLHHHRRCLCPGGDRPAGQARKPVQSRLRQRGPPAAHRGLVRSLREGRRLPASPPDRKGGHMISREFLDSVRCTEDIVYKTSGGHRLLLDRTAPPGPPVCRGLCSCCCTGADGSGRAKKRRSSPVSSIRSGPTLSTVMAGRSLPWSTACCGNMPCSRTSSRTAATPHAFSSNMRTSIMSIPGTSSRRALLRAAMRPS